LSIEDENVNPPEDAGAEGEAPEDAPAPEEPAAEADAPAEEPAAEEPAAEAEQPDEPAEEPAAEAEQPDEPAEEPAAEAEEPAEEQPEPAKEPAERGAKKQDLPPGAELTPIAIEPERQLDAEERAKLEAEAEERARLEAEATSDTGEEPVARREPTVQLEAGSQIQATGKRKNSIARVILRPGSGVVEVNKRPLEDYFPRHYHQTVARQPLVTSGYESTVDVRVRVHGGGISGQAGAVRHGIARALCDIDPELRPELKRRGLLTRDARIKERRKAGLKKARKRPQFSKR
jgi:small subunit ribosomal protein S9